MVDYQSSFGPYYFGYFMNLKMLVIHSVFIMMQEYSELKVSRC